MSIIKKGRKLSEEHKEKLRGKIPWNKGLTGIIYCSEEIKRKISEVIKGKIRGKYKNKIK